MLGTVLNLLTKSLPRLLTQRPDLLVDHALAYASLAKDELEAMKGQMVKRAVAGAVALASGVAFVILAGVALMLCAVTTASGNPVWVLVAVPGVMLVVTIVATIIALSKGEPLRSSTLAAQLRMDAQAFRSVMEARP